MASHGPQVSPARAGRPSSPLGPNSGWSELWGSESTTPGQRCYTAMNGAALRHWRCWVLLGAQLGMDAGCRPAPTPASWDASPPRASASSVASVRSDPTAEAQDLDTFRRVFHWSEPGELFISDNLISNETSYLFAATTLLARQGGAYLGVGPEQNLSYLAFARPEIAFMVDLRRDNALLHLLYHAIFETADRREQFVSLLLGRPWSGTPSHAGSDASAVLIAVEQAPPDHDWFALRHAELRQRLERHDLGLSPQDFDRIGTMHEQFFVRQLELRFELRRSSGRAYPTLRSLLGAHDHAGHGSFLATEEGFRFVQGLERRHRVIPVVGNLAAREPLGQIASELRSRRLPVRVVYVSNVEQYLMGTPAFGGWLTNLDSLPTDGASLLVRSYLDQGRRHPRQAPGERTTTLVHSLGRFLARAKERPYGSYYQLATDESLRIESGEPSQDQRRSTRD
jgi:hypothetical protein